MTYLLVALLQQKRNNFLKIQQFTLFNCYKMKQMLLG